MLSDQEAYKRAVRLLDGPRPITDEEALAIAQRRFWDVPVVSDEEALRRAEGRNRPATVDVSRLMKKFGK